MSANPGQPRRRSARLAAQAARQTAPASTLSSLSSLSDLPSPPPAPAPPPTSTPALATLGSDPKWNQLYELLGSNEIPLTPGKFVSLSRITRPSNWYERHLANRYQLRSIRVLRNLPTALSSYARHTFDTIQSTTQIPPTESFLIEFKSISKRCKRLCRPEAEPGVEDFYNARASCWCTLGSMKYLQTEHWDEAPAVYWSKNVSDRGLGIADGVLRIWNADVNDDDDLWDLIDKHKRHKWQLLSDNTVKYTLANWEFESPSVGSKPVMDEVERLDGSFQWATCNGIQCPEHSKRLSVAASVPLGPDAMWSSTATWLEGTRSFFAQVFGLICFSAGCSSAFPDRDHPSDPDIESVSATLLASTLYESPNVRTAHSMVQQVCYAIHI